MFFCIWHPPCCQKDIKIHNFRKIAKLKKNTHIFYPSGLARRIKTETWRCHMSTVGSRHPQRVAGSVEEGKTEPREEVRADSLA